MNPVPPQPAAPASSFEERLARLEILVGELESGQLSLESGIERYAEGVALLQTLGEELASAELKVEELTAVLRNGLERLAAESAAPESAEEAGDAGA